MELKDLVGEHVLTGVDRENIRIKEEYGEGFELCDCISFVLDGIVYTAIEDPSDGYRSCMSEIKAGGEPVKNSFSPVRVLGRMQTEGEYHSVDEILELVDVANGKVILRVGTDNTDDYYPSWVGQWSPEDMACNKEMTDEELVARMVDRMADRMEEE